MLHDGQEVGEEGLLVHFLQADNVRIVPQHLLRNQRPPVRGLHEPANQGRIC